MIEYRTYGENKIAQISNQNMHTLQDALDVMGTAWYNGCDAVILDKTALHADFFNLRTGLAGEILQKFSNYKMRIAIVGDFSAVSSKALRDFIYESNNGRRVFFLPTAQAAIDALTS